ncbi:MAG: TIGR03986 family CRISPR-associated RAMP protein [Bacteroidales bacterium]|nr:TIGR03986 family CRISPR-associated RAMP protein [Bacteroidales bacterium]
MSIKAPFNFIPVSSKVFTPDWADRISHDVPFSDGESGVIELTITAKTPVYVRNGHTQQEREETTPDFLAFSNINDRHFIPGTSLKGTIRNALEILSFGKIKIDKNMKFATRDWEDKRYKDFMGSQNQIHCGWLYLEGEKIKVKDCGKPKRINHLRIDEFFKTKGIKVEFEKYFSIENGINLEVDQNIGDKVFDPKTAVYKYALINNNVNALKDINFEEDEIYCKEFQVNRVKIGGSDDEGTIVFTGSPDKWKHDRSPSSGKFYEFIFPKITNSNPIEIGQQDYAEFKYFQSDSPDWQFWSEKLNKGGEMPIFFRTVEDNRARRIKDFGLAFLYKIPYKYGPYDLLPDRHKSNNPDLAECIFGFTSSDNALKGRVHFGHAFATHVVPAEEVSVALGSPKASYYPVYVEQINGRDGTVASYTTYFDKVNISGRKFYPVRSKVWNEQAERDDLNSKFIPLGSDSIFKSKITFHNLRKAEIGGLLSALTFHNSTGYFHLIGLAKPYGFGKVQIKVSLSENLNTNINDYLCSFEEMMVESPHTFDGSLGWHTSEQIKQFFTLSFDFNSAGDDLLRYMAYENSSGINEFLKAKEQKKYLQLYTSLMKNPRLPMSIYEPEMVTLRAMRVEEQFIKEELSRIAKENKIHDLEKERIKIKDIIAIEASAKGLNLDNFDSNHKTAWDILKKTIEKYVTAYYKSGNYDKIVKDNPSGVLKEEEHDKVVEVCKVIFSNANKSDQKALAMPFDKNPVLKKIAQWIGKDKAEKITFI